MTSPSCASCFCYKKARRLRSSPRPGGAEPRQPPRMCHMPPPSPATTGGDDRTPSAGVLQKREASPEESGDAGGGRRGAEGAWGGLRGLKAPEGARARPPARPARAPRPAPLCPRRGGGARPVASGEPALPPQTHTETHTLSRAPGAAKQRRFCDRVTAKWCDIPGGRRSSSRGGRALPGPSAAPGRGSAPRPGGDRTAPRPSARRDPHERRGGGGVPPPRPPACLSTERSPRPRCALSPGPGPASLAPLPAGGGGSSSVQVRTSNPSAMASNAAEREILFTELQVSGGDVPPGAAPAPLRSPPSRGGWSCRRPHRAPPPPARRSARGAHPTPRPGRGGGGGGSSYPPQASSRCFPPGAEAPPPGHGPTPQPAPRPAFVCSRLAPSPRRAAASLRQGLPRAAPPAPARPRRLGSARRRRVGCPLPPARRSRCGAW